jgi:hypothetical protein
MKMKIKENIKFIATVISTIFVIIGLISYFTGTNKFSQLLEFLHIKKPSNIHKRNGNLKKPTQSGNSIQNNQFSNSPPNSTESIKKNSLSILIVEDVKKINWDLTHRMASLLKKSGREVITSPVLNDTFVLSGEFEQIYNGSKIQIERLGERIPTALLILGKQNTIYFKDPDYEGLITADITIQFKILSVIKGSVENSFPISKRGGGYSKNKAHNVAVRNVLKIFPLEFPKIPNQ